MKEKLTNNLSLKILSVIAAVLLWLVVVNVDDPVKTETYTGIRVNMINETAITSKGKVYKIEDNTDLISVSVSAKRSVHKKLTSADFIATADMEKDIQYDNLVAINVTCTNKDIKVSDIKKSWNNVKISIEDSATEEFNVVVKQKGTPGSGYVVGEMVPEQRVISVTGPASLIAKIKRIEAEVDVTGRTADDVVTCSLKVVNSDGDELDTTYLEFNGKGDGMSVKVTMLRTKEVPLRIRVSGTPASGYQYTGMSFKPEQVEIAGTSADLRGVSAIEVPEEAVSVEGLTEETTIEVNLLQYLPEGIRLVDEDADGVVVVTVEIEGEETRELSVPIENVALMGVPKGYSVSFGDLEEITILIGGLREKLDSLELSDVAVTLDVSSVSKAGSYTLPLEIHVSGDCSAAEETEITFELLKGESGKGNTADGDGEEENGASDNGGSGTGETSGSGSTGNSGAESGNAEGEGTAGSSGNGNSNSGTGGGAADTDNTTSEN